MVAILTVTLLPLDHHPKLSLLSGSGRVVALPACAWVGQHIWMVSLATPALAPGMWHQSEGMRVLQLHLHQLCDLGQVTLHL